MDEEVGELMAIERNYEFQFYKGIKLQLINRSYAKGEKRIGHAMRFTLNGQRQNVWIPNKHLLPDGTLKIGENIDYVFRKAQRSLEKAGYLGPIPGIKRWSKVSSVSSIIPSELEKCPACSHNNFQFTSFQLVDDATNKLVMKTLLYCGHCLYLAGYLKEE